MPAHYRVKGHSLRAIIDWMQKRGFLEKIRDRVSPETALLLRSPPLQSTWIDAQPLDDIMAHLDPLIGANGHRQMSRELSESSADGLRVTAARAVLRVIGATPNAMFSRMNDILATSLQDVAYEWVKTGEKQGVITVTYSLGKDVPFRRFWGFVGPFELMFRLVNAEGTVGDPVRKTHNSAAFAIEWK